MMRLVHRWLGLVLALLLLISSLSGVVLGVYPAVDAYSAAPTAPALSVAQLAARVQATHPGLEQIKRDPSGQISAWWFDAGQPGSALIDPATGRDIASADPSTTRRWFTTLHRSLFLGDAGRWCMALAALGLLLLSCSGAWLVAKRLGGWRRWFAPVRGSFAARWHTLVSRVAVLVLLPSSLTALWMAAETFEWIQVEPAAPMRVALSPAAALPPLPVSQIAVLRATPVTSLRDLSFPAPDDAQDVYTLSTDSGSGTIDQGKGNWLSWQALTPWQKFSETIKLLHTGVGASVWGLVLALAAASVPLLAGTGVWLWWCARRARPRFKTNVRAAQAELVLLVGSESGSTWGFAVCLAQALHQAGKRVHVAALKDFAPQHYHAVQQFVLLASTYGDGAAPASAQGFIEKLGRLPQAPTAPVAILGFGDRSYPQFCGYAQQLARSVQALHWAEWLPLHGIHQQSAQDFAQWGRRAGQALNIALDLAYQPPRPATQSLTLLSRRDYGLEYAEHSAILRFALPPSRWWQRMLKRGLYGFRAGDLLGIVPQGSRVPRLYSLASSASDGFIEIVVRKHPQGLASGQLTALEPGQTVQAFLRPNPGFHAQSSRAPSILIGAGTGVGPLAGFIRANRQQRALHLFYGLRRSDSDFLYERDLQQWQQQGQLTQLHVAQSRGPQALYVQDVLRREAVSLRKAVAEGAQIMVCGSRDMAQGVLQALQDILHPLGLSPQVLKDQARYAEDVY